DDGLAVACARPALARDVIFEAAARDRAADPPELGEQHARAGSAVRRAVDAYDGRDQVRLARAAQASSGVDDGAFDGHGDEDSSVSTWYYAVRSHLDQTDAVVRDVFAAGAVTDEDARSVRLARDAFDAVELRRHLVVVVLVAG